MTYKTQGIILKHIDLGEASRLFTIYTKDFGKISVRAKAVKKPTSKLAGHLEPLTLSQLVLAQGKFLDIIIDALAINNFKGLRSSLGGLAFGIYACELVDKLTGEGIPNERVFSLMKFSFNRAEAKLQHELQYAFYFGLKLLALLGFAPEEEQNWKGLEVLEKKFKYYLSFAPEAEIRSEGFLREVIG